MSLEMVQTIKKAEDAAEQAERAAQEEAKKLLKIFDLVYVIPPGASKPAANVIAVEMWTVSFGGGNDYGLGSALAILLLVLVLPSMIMNIRRFREERSR